MSTAALSAGHSQRVPGASSPFGKEEILARDFVSRVSRYFKLGGWGVVDCTDNVGTSKSEVWSNCANNHLRVNSSFDATFHFNSHDGTGHGTEVLYHPSYGNYSKCESLGKIVANAFGTRWRGVQSRPDLGWLNKTKTDYYFELLFLDNESDMQKYNQNADKAAKALVEAVTGKSIQNGGGNTVAIDDGKRKIQTGGLGVEAVKEVSGILLERNIQGSIIFDGEGAMPYLITEKLGNPKLDNFTAWLDGKGWYYDYI